MRKVLKNFKKGLFKYTKVCYCNNSWLNTVQNKGVLNSFEFAFFARKNLTYLQYWLILPKLVSYKIYRWADIIIANLLTDSTC